MPNVPNVIKIGTYTTAQDITVDNINQVGKQRVAVPQGIEGKKAGQTAVVF